VERYRHRLPAVLCAALQLALSLAVTADLVLCTEASGDVAVESAFSAECCDGHALPEGLRSKLDRDDCGCTDRPLLQGPVEVRSRLEQPVDAPPLAVGVVGASPDVGPLASTWSPSGRWSPAKASALVARRSVVLIV
jgi:hypothetical protein